MKKNNDGTRAFGAKINNFTSPEEAAFLKRALKAYIKGHKLFSFGVNKLTRKRNYYNVPETLS